MVEPLKLKPLKNKVNFKNDWDFAQSQIKASRISNSNFDFKSGEDEALNTLQKFIKQKLRNYEKDKNNPLKNVLSNLSPYLHFGQISSLRVVLEILKDFEFSEVEAFLDEIIVRKELSDNFCLYNENYDSFEGLKPWAKKTLVNHKIDKREFLYSVKDLETANTHDKAWNKAQMQMITTGKMHGYMRMYWAKKILEWTNSPEEAIEVAIYLNDKYSLDGYDPNGYVGILWSIGGLHDRPWAERNIFGQIRYMNFNGLKRKFNVEQFVGEDN